MSTKPRKPTLTLPSSAFFPLPSIPKRDYPLKIVDSHVHLWTAAQLEDRMILWPKREKLDFPHDLTFYSAVSSRGREMFGGGKAVLEGFVFVQVENIHDDTDIDGSKGGWKGGLGEFAAVCNAVGTVGEGESKLLGIVAWAPVPLGPVAMSLYHSQLLALPLKNQNHSLLKSYRYLVQDSSPGFLLKPDFIAGLKWLAVGGETNGCFDLTVDVTHAGIGASVLEEVVDCIGRVREGQEEGKETRFILDHFSKPDLKTEPTMPPSKEYQLYIKSLFRLALFPEVVLKLSALLSSCDPDLVRQAFSEHCNSSQPSPSITKLETLILYYLEPALESFGDERILIGADWPMFRIILTNNNTSLDIKERSKIDIEKEARAWEFQFDLYRKCLVRIGVDGEGLDKIFSENSKRFYRL